MGMKTKSPQSLVTGLMWLRQHERYQSELPLRHTCEHGDKLLKYGWLAHDGVNFGIQDVVEQGYSLRTSFVKVPGGRHGGEWTWRVTGTQTGASPVTISLFFYAATDGQGKLISVVKDTKNGRYLTQINGETEELGKFKIIFPAENTGVDTRYHTVSTKAEGLHKLKEAALRKMQATIEKSGNNKDKVLYFLGDSASHRNPPGAKSDVVFHQVTLKLPFEIDIIFESETSSRKSQLSGETFTQELAQWKEKFDQNFEERFPLKDKGYDSAKIAFAKAMLSNMVGGIGYFYGHSLVQSENQKTPVKYWDAGLLTAVPSRSFFPRGFLWDEGFHQLLISKWDRTISEEIIEHWLNLLNKDGWIPREQILGEEARSKVPAEFVVQQNKNANPPTLFLAIESILKGFNKDEINEHDTRFLKKIFPRLEVWYKWFNTTQVGTAPFSYRWRGRKEGTDDELNPKTLTSGLDDYPRSSHPSQDERHIDLRCWMAVASGTMAKIAKVVDPDSAPKFEATHKLLTNHRIMNELHWSAEMGLFSDYGNHSDRVYLTRKTFQPAQPNQRPYTKMVRIEKQKPKLRFTDTFGYVSLFPFLLQILKPDSQQLTQILEDLSARDLLWTEYGLRSLSKRDPLYMKRNTEHDPPYWRGAVWINMNYLAVRALKRYSQPGSRNSEKAAKLYQELRSNLVNNIYNEYARSGYVWESYNDMTGKGQGTHPFTGWSALVVLMMSEQY
uniref:mannosyl-oligosaccharide glucosidase-like n=1 Tax=Ciona intestinalis TaxID=7719 RepID=UPI000180B057|nr:mannosyl-oligosaccharide glucosidase-like [Ciona intestinalis]|eukprot:XP_009858246.1 mannosyl-oligosaccharide glucosidase-like [Ciona intestinalis]